MNIPLLEFVLTPQTALVAVLAGWVMTVTSWVITNVIFRIFIAVLNQIAGSSLSVHQGKRWLDYVEQWAMQISCLIGVFIVLLVSWGIVNALM